MERVAEEAALKRSSELGVRVLEWTLDALGEDDALERFLVSIPGFYKSDVVKTRDFPRGLMKTSCGRSADITLLLVAQLFIKFSLRTGHNPPARPLSRRRQCS